MTADVIPFRLQLPSSKTSLAPTRSRRDHAGQPAGRELARQIGFVETEEVEAQHGGRGPLNWIV